MLVSFDSSLTWSTSTNDPTASEVDAEHVAAHELGHLTGFIGGPIDHFSRDADCDRDVPVDYSEWETMCTSVDQIIGTDDEYGLKFRRTLETHDTHTF